MSDPVRSVTVAGGGLAGFTVTRELRAGGFDGAVRIVDPGGAPYDRPPLSKGYLTGEVTAEGIRLVPEDWYAENSVELITDRVTKLSPGTGDVVLERRGDLDSDVVVLATGGVARTLPIPGAAHPAVQVLRDTADAAGLRARLRPDARLVVVGAGLIGAEVASSAVALGVAAVTLVEPAPVPLAPVVGPELAQELHAMHEQNGGRVVHGTPARIEESGAAVLVDVERPGQEDLVIEADVVLVAIGTGADVSLATDAGLAVTGAVEKDAGGRTSNPAVYAAGDGSRTRLPDGTLLGRTEHWEAAMLDGAAVARSILGIPHRERPPSWFWSDRYGVHVEATGSMSAPGTTVLREGCGRHRVAFRIDGEGRLVGCASINGGKALRAARKIIGRGAPVGAADLRDPAVDLKKLAAKPPRS